MRLSKILFLIIMLLSTIKSGYAADCSKYHACDIRFRNFTTIGHNMITEHGMEGCDDWTIMRLDLTTGVFSQALGIFNGECSIYGAVIKADWSHNIMFVSSKMINNDVDIVSMKTGKVIGVLKNVIDSGFYINKIIVSPDGAVIYVQTENEDIGGHWTKIYSGSTYNTITTTSEYRINESFIGYTGVFTKDSKYLYAIISITPIAPYHNDIVKVDAHTGNVLKNIETIPFEGKNVNFVVLGLHASNVPATIDDIYVVVVFNNQSPYYVYNTNTGGLSVSIPIGGSLRAQFKLSPDNKYLLTTLYNYTYTGEINVYSIATGKLVAKMVTGTVTQLFPSSSIISWSDDHTFIYNTGQKLIYFDILQNKIVKELPIIKPWEKPCWAPVDTVHASCRDWEKQAEKLK